MANLIMRFPGGLPKALTLSYDDGVEQDERLLAIAEQYGLKGTLNINSGCLSPEGTTWAPGTIHRRMPLSRLKDVCANSSWEIAAHAYTHASLVGLPGNLAAEEVLRDRKELEAIFGTVVRGFAYPYGAFDDQTVAVLKACGFSYARTVISSRDFHLPQNWLTWSPTCHHADPELMNLADRFIGLREWWDPLLFYLWGHSYEFEACNNWEVLEAFAEKVSGKPDIWYATNGEIRDYCDAFSRLIFNTAMTLCVNPTATDLWFAYGKKEVHVPAGQSVLF